MFESNVFQRTEYVKDELISAGAYNMIIGAVLLWGFALNYIIIQAVPTSALVAINHWAIMIPSIVSMIAGTILFSRSDKPVFSFLGYNLVVIPFGFMLNMIISRYAPGVVEQAMGTTGGVTLVMMAMGTLFPAFFLSLGRVLFFALIAVIGVELVQMIFFNTHSTWIDWVVVVIFSGYIGYDWARANAIPRTVDNAIDSAASIYMDIVNLFIRLLSILGGRRD